VQQPNQARQGMICRRQLFLELLFQVHMQWPQAHGAWRLIGGILLISWYSPWVRCVFINTFSPESLNPRTLHWTADEQQAIGLFAQAISFFYQNVARFCNPRPSLFNCHHWNARLEMLR